MYLGFLTEGFSIQTSILAPRLEKPWGDLHPGTQIFNLHKYFPLPGVNPEDGVWISSHWKQFSVTLSAVLV